MTMFRALVTGVALLAFGSASGAQEAISQKIPSEYWTVYKNRFVDASGRVVDDGNGGISHSEGQGYGMLLAYFAGSRADFDAIWAFTQRELLLRNDGLSAWKWSPTSAPNITDLNNASDGDILIGYALALAGKGWQRPDYTQAATAIVKALSATVVLGSSLLLPAASGFDTNDRADGPVVNLSYWIFEAFPVFAELDPSGNWPAVSNYGLTLVQQMSSQDGTLPPDWLSLQARAKPAKGFVPEFSYNAVRIPLYLARSGIMANTELRNLANAMSVEGGVGLKNVRTGETVEVLTDPGYRIIPALALCKADGTAIPTDLRTFQATIYYPSTLHLLALAWLGTSRCQ